MKKLSNKQRKRLRKKKKRKDLRQCMILEKRFIKPIKPLENPHAGALATAMTLIGLKNKLK